MSESCGRRSCHCTTGKPLLGRDPAPPPNPGCPGCGRTDGAAIEGGACASCGAPLPAGLVLG